MSDPHTTAEILPPAGSASAQALAAPENARIVVIIMYALYFATLITGLTYFAAVVLAYVKRDDLRGTIYEGHIKNGIEVFWVTLIGSIIGWLTVLLGIGIAILFGLFLWFLYRTIKGFIRALDARPYR